LGSFSGSRLARRFSGTEKQLPGTWGKGVGLTAVHSRTIGKANALPGTLSE